MQFVDTFSCDNNRADIVYQINDKAWNNAEFFFYTQQINVYCGGGSYENYIIDANGHFITLFKTHTFYDDGDDPETNYSKEVFPENVMTDTISFHKVQSYYIRKRNRKTQIRILTDSISYFRWTGKTPQLIGQKTEIVNED